MASVALNSIVKSLSVVDQKRSLSLLAMDWTIIFGAIILCEQFWNWPLYILAVMIIGARQHALGGLLHDAAHYRIVKNKFWNDLISNFFMGYPLLISLERYRDFHFKHHTHVGTPDDPERRISADPTRNPPFSWPTFWLYLVMDLTGITFLRFFATSVYFSFVQKPYPARSTYKGFRKAWHLVQRPLYTVAVVGALWQTGHLWTAFMYWIVPMGTFLNATFRIRTLAEHQCLPAENELNETRNVIIGPLSSFFIAPHNVNYHLTHHLYPSIPCYNLPQMHKELIKHHPEYDREGGKNYGYLLGSRSVRRDLVDAAKCMKKEKAIS